MLFAIQFTPCQLEYGSSFWGTERLNKTRTHRSRVRNFALKVEAVSALFLALGLFLIKIIRELGQSQEKYVNFLKKGGFFRTINLINKMI
jgi:hypothetical protein